MGADAAPDRRGSWNEVLAGLWRLMAVHAPYGPGWYADYAQDTQLAYFVGGPWDGRLAWVSSHLYRRGRMYVPEEPKDLILGIAWDELIRPEQVKYQIVDYFVDAPLPTGVPVFSCLWGCPTYPAPR